MKDVVVVITKPQSHEYKDHQNMTWYEEIMIFSKAHVRHSTSVCDIKYKEKID